jgi:hypothetical protein
VTSTFRVLYVLVVIEHHSRRLIHFNGTAHPTAQWTRQQLREAVGYEEQYAYLLHDRDSIFSARAGPLHPAAGALSSSAIFDGHSVASLFYQRSRENNEPTRFCVVARLCAVVDGTRH